MPVDKELLLTRTLPEAVESRASDSYSVRLNVDDEQYNAEKLIARAENCDALLVSPTDKFDAMTLASLPKSIQIIATFSVGYDHIDIAAAKRLGLAVTNTPDVLSDATADLAMLLLLGAARRAGEGEALMRAHAWTGWCPTQLMGVQVTGKRVGILGMGRIGRAFAERCRGFGMEIHYSNRSRLPEVTEQGAIYHADPDEMLPLVNFLSLHAPSMPETRHFINADRIARMNPDMILVNSARGALIEDEALIEALRMGKIKAAGLDVFNGEPAVDSRYADLPNTFLLPHLGSATIETRNAMGFRALDNLDAFFVTGDAPDRLV